MSADRLKLLLSFAVGGLLGDVFLHLLPEAFGPVNSGKLYFLVNKPRSETCIEIHWRLVAMNRLRFALCS